MSGLLPRPGRRAGKGSVELGQAWRELESDAIQATQQPRSQDRLSSRRNVLSRAVSQWLNPRFRLRKGGGPHALDTDPTKVMNDIVA